MNNIQLSIIIVNYKNYKLTIKCIESIKKFTRDISYKIIVIDNCSPNESYEELSKMFSMDEYVEIIKNNINSGFGSANNLGVQKSSSEFIMILNPDIIFEDESIKTMLNYLKNSSNVGIVSGKLLNQDHTVQYSCRRTIPFRKFLFCRTPFKKLVKNEIVKKYDSEYLMLDKNHDITMSVDWVMGACMMMRRSEFMQVGGFSKEYFMYFEDVDLCLKYKKNNKEVIYLSDAKMIHLHAQESTKKINKMTFIHLNSMIKFYIKRMLGRI